MNWQNGDPRAFSQGFSALHMQGQMQGSPTGLTPTPHLARAQPHPTPSPHPSTASLTASFGGLRTQTPQIFTPLLNHPSFYSSVPVPPALASLYPPGSWFVHQILHGWPNLSPIMQNNPGQPQQGGGGQPGQNMANAAAGINMNQLVRAQHIQNLPNLTIQQKNQLVSAVSQCATMVQSSQPGSEQHTRGLLQWQTITQRYVAARNQAAKNAQQAAANAAAGGGGGGGGGGQAQGQGQMNMQMNMGNMNMGGQNTQMGQAGPSGQQGQQGGGNQAGANAGQAQKPPGQQAQAGAGIPPQILDYVNKYTYYHPSGIGPGHPKYEEYRQDVKLKHAKILYDNERNKSELKKIKSKIEQLQSAGQEIPQTLQEMRQSVEQKTNDLGAQLQKWTQNQELFRKKYEEQRGAQQGGAGASSSDGNTNTQGQAGSPVSGGPQGNQNRTGSTAGQMSPGLPQSATGTSQPQNNMNNQQGSFSAQGGQGGQSLPQQNPQSATAGPQSQRPSISGQQPPMANMPNAPQGGQANPTALTHQQALQRAYSGGGTPGQQPQSAGGPANNQAAQPHPTQHAPQPQQPTPYAGGQAPPRETTASSSSNMNPSAKMMSSKVISPSLSQPPVPVQNFPQARPTMAGPANGVGGIMGQPAIVKPSFTLESAEGGGVLSKKKLDELVRQVTGGGEGLGGETITPDVEEALLMMADEFVDNVIVASCKLARLRDSSTLDVRDIQHILERNYNIRVPGYASDEIRAIRKYAPAPGWVQKMSAVNAAKVMGGGKGEL